MNKLQLCQRLRQEARIAGTGPTSVLAQTGEYKKIVDWIDSAYEDIQNLHTGWKFLQYPFSFTVTIGKRDYTPTEALLTQLQTWKYHAYGDIRCYLIASDEQRLEFVPWDDFRGTYLIGASRTATGRPGFFSVEPDNTINFDVLPDAAYTIVGEYFKKPQTMDADTSEPLFRSNFHMAIVWRALMFYGADYAAEEKYTHGYNEYRKVIKKLEQDQLNRLVWGGPLV
jgi:hypothetical protein